MIKRKVCDANHVLGTSPGMVVRMAICPKELDVMHGSMLGVPRQLAKRRDG